MQDNVIRKFTSENLASSSSMRTEEEMTIGFTQYSFEDWDDKMPQPDWAQGTDLEFSKSYNLQTAYGGTCRFYTSTEEMNTLFLDEINSLGEVELLNDQIQNGGAILYRLISNYLVNKYNDFYTTFSLTFPLPMETFYVLDFEKVKTERKPVYDKLQKFSKKISISLERAEIKVTKDEGGFLYDFVNDAYFSGQYMYFIMETFHPLQPHLKSAIKVVNEAVHSIYLAYGFVLGYLDFDDLLYLHDEMYNEIMKTNPEESRGNEIEIIELFTNKATIFVKLIEKEEILKLVTLGENKFIEFKSTLRYNTRSNQIDKDLEQECLKTVAAFLNTEGGTLLIGIDDNKDIVGIAKDGFKNKDQFLLYLKDLVVTRFEPSPFDSTEFDIMQIGSKEICQVKCKQSHNPIYLKEKEGEAFYIRTGPSSKKLQPRDLVNYIKHRFPHN